MATPNKTLMANARESLKGKWKIVVKVSIIYFLITMLIQLIPVLGMIASIIITGPLTLGLVIFYLALSRGQEVKLEKMFEGFHTWVRALKAYVLMTVYIILWSLLLIVPGIIATLSYSQTFYILADDKNIGIRDAITKSKKMMDGYKWKLVYLNARFIGWLLLCIPTFGIGFLWLTPYMYTTAAKFYDDIKDNNKIENESVPTV